MPHRPKAVEIRYMTCSKLQGLTLLRLMEVMHWNANAWNINHVKKIKLKAFHFEDAPEGYEFWDKVLNLEITNLSRKQ